MENGRPAPGVLRALERCAAALWLAAIGWLLFATLAAQLARAAEIPTDLGAGTLFFRSEAGLDPAAPLSTHVRISVSGIVARVAVTQRFRNTGGERLEALYAFPLPDDAAVDRLTMRVGDRLIEGEIREREQAERLYADARDSGRRASLVSQSTPNLFTTAVANIGPGEAVDVTIEYLQTARYDAGELSLRFPMTFTPRYGERAAAAAEDGPAPPPGAAAARAPAPAVNEAVIEAVVDAGIALAEVGSRHHEVRVRRRGRRYVIETTAPRVPMDRDFVLHWRPHVGAAPAVAALTETVGDTTYALLMILPPTDSHAFVAQPRELICVVDTSGSMGGQSIEQAKAALANALGRLTGADRFNVFRFDSTTASLYRTPVPFDGTTYAEALEYVQGLQANGGTEMKPAIRAALSQPASRGHLRQVIFLTDGGVANEQELFATIKQHLGDARLFTVGIGAAPNTYFMRKAAQFGRGTYTHIGDESAVAGAMQALFDKLERVALTDVVVDWPDAQELYPHQVPDLYAGEPVVVVGSFPARGAGTIDVRVWGRAGGEPWSQAVKLASGSAPGVAALWARRKVEYLLDSRVDGVDEELIRKMVVDVALEHRLVTPYTSLVAVDRTPATAAGPLARRRIANMAPAGQAYASLPQTGTPAALFRLLSLVFLAAALVLLRCARYAR
ncbi:MAG TPA: marine proteobacterial sortase target protein [Gammaproteobacteria bacterium]